MILLIESQPIEATESKCLSHVAVHGENRPFLTATTVDVSINTGSGYMGPFAFSK
jgi:hypothetical protein